MQRWQGPRSNPLPRVIQKKTMCKRSSALLTTRFPTKRYVTNSGIFLMYVGLLTQLLLNAAWESPHDPYVGVHGYDPQVLALLERASLTVRHPEADAICLHAFHEALPDPSASRPSIYG